MLFSCKLLQSFYVNYASTFLVANAARSKRFFDKTFRVEPALIVKTPEISTAKRRKYAVYIQIF